MSSSVVEVWPRAGSSCTVHVTTIVVIGPSHRDDVKGFQTAVQEKTLFGLGRCTMDFYFWFLQLPSITTILQ